MFVKYKVTMNFQEKLCGSVPLAKEMIRPWLEARMPSKKPAGAKDLEEIEKETLETSVEKEIERTTLGFQKNDGGLFVRGGTIKAHMKDCANQIKEIAKIKSFRSKVANKIHVQEYHVPIFKNGRQIKKEDGEFEKAIHVFQGDALKKVKYVEKPTLNFTLVVLRDKEVTLSAIELIFRYGSIHGYGGERGDGEGRYDFSISFV